MLSQPVTLVVVTRDRVVRAEFRARNATKPTSLVVRERPDSDDPISPIVTALSGERRSPGRVFVLSSDVWTRTIEVPTINLKNLSPAELQQSMAYEVEPLSGLASSEAATAVVSLAELQKAGEAWIGQISAATLAELDEVVRGAGGKLAGVLHPAAVPDSLDGIRPAVRIEFWADATARVVALGDRLTLQVEQGAATANRQAIIDEWHRQSPGAPIEVLVPDFRPPIDDERTFHDEATLESWLALWHRTLTARKVKVPVIRPAPRPLSVQQRRNIAAVLCLATLAACAGYRHWTMSSIAKNQAEQNLVEAPGRELATIKQQQGETEKATAKLKEEIAKRATEVGYSELMLVAHRKRFGELLERLGRESSKEWVLREIDGTPREIKLVGMTMHPEHISQLAAELAEDLADLGWAVDPPNHTARNLRDDGGPWTFELKLRDESIAAPKPIADTTKPAGPPSLVRVPME